MNGTFTEQSYPSTATILCNRAPVEKILGNLLKLKWAKRIKGLSMFQEPENGGSNWESVFTDSSLKKKMDTVVKAAVLRTFS